MSVMRMKRSVVNLMHWEQGVGLSFDERLNSYVTTDPYTHERGEGRGMNEVKRGWLSDWVNGCSFLITDCCLLLYLRLTVDSAHFLMNRLDRPETNCNRCAISIHTRTLTGINSIDTTTMHCVWMRGNKWLWLRENNEEVKWMEGQ